MGKIYYKVVNNKLKSVIVQDVLSIQYKIGKFVESPYRLPLAVFDNKDKAVVFARDWYGRLFECEIERKTKKSWLPATSLIGFWRRALPIITRIKNKKKYLDYVCYDLPKSTVTCKRVKLIKEIVV